MWRIPALVLLAVLALSGAAVADDEAYPSEPPGGLPPDDRLDDVLRAWLDEGNDRQAAWAGWLAGERRRHGLVPWLKGRLARVEATRAGYFVGAPILDALIRLEAAAPRHALVRLSGYHTEAVATLLCRQETYQAVHLEVFRALDGGLAHEAWTALGNFMAHWRSRAFVEDLLESYRIERLVRVWDQDPPYPGFRRGGDHIPGDGFFDAPRATPPSRATGCPSRGVAGPSTSCSRTASAPSTSAAPSTANANWVSA